MTILKTYMTLTKGLILLGFFFIFNNSTIAQESNANIDSLEYVFESYKGRNNTSEKLALLRKLSLFSKDPQKKLKFSNQLIKLAPKKDSTEYLYVGYMQKGNALRLKSDLPQALESFLKASEIATTIKEQNSSELTALSNITIGDVYSIMGNHDNAVIYYQSGIAKLREIKSDSIKLASALLNAGDEYFNAGKYDEAMTYFYESSLISNKIGFKSGTAYNLGNIGMVYAKKGKHKLARANIDEAIKILESEKDYYPIAVYLEFIADIYLDQNKPILAQVYAERSLDLSKKYQLKDQISTASLKLANIYELQNKPELSLISLKEYITYKDSVSSIASVQKMANLRTEFEIEKKQVELDLKTEKQKAQRLTIIGTVSGLVLMSLLLFGLFRRNKHIKRTTKIIDEERKKSESLLLNVLPEEAAQELKENGKVLAKKYEAVSVLFTDFKDFTQYAENLAPEKLVTSVDFYFSKFDDIIEKYNLEKIKTIGDSYMCASGLPNPTDDHAENMANAALEILAFVNDTKKKHSVNDVRFDIRIGIHSGPVVSGVVGKNKFAYDIWGDTVNIASRMESTSKAGKINISESTYELIKNKFIFKERGKVAVKNRAALNMFYLLEKK